MLKPHLSIRVFVVYIDIGSPIHNIPSKSRGLADENKKVLTEWKWFETSVLVIMNMKVFKYILNVIVIFNNL
jgi:hypothetical protein